MTLRIMSFIELEAAFLSFAGDLLLNGKLRSGWIAGSLHNTPLSSDRTSTSPRYHPHLQLLVKTITLRVRKVVVYSTQEFVIGGYPPGTHGIDAIHWLLSR